MRKPVEPADDAACGGMAKKHVDNWKKWEAFGRGDYERNYDGVAIFYTHNRDSDTSDMCNAKVIEKLMEPFLDDEQAWSYDASHFAVGWVEGFAIRARDKVGNFTDAWRMWVGIQERLDSYPILDEDKLSDMETERDLAYVTDQIKCVFRALPFDEKGDIAAGDVVRWLDDHHSRQTEDQGDGMAPCEEAVFLALVALEKVPKPRCPHCEGLGFALAQTGEYRNPVVQCEGCDASYARFARGESESLDELYPESA